MSRQSVSAPYHLPNAAHLTLVGISSYARAGHPPAFSIPTGYVDAVRRAGAVPVVFPPGEPDPACLLDTLSALIVSGGGDINPGAYGGRTHETVYSVCEERDAFEFALVRAALADTRVPLLCICRGLQVLNVVCGGTLHVHLPEHYGDRVTHRAPPRQPSTRTVRPRLTTVYTAGAPNSADRAGRVQPLGSSMRIAPWRSMRMARSPASLSPDIAMSIISSACRKNAFTIGISVKDEEVSEKSATTAA